MQAAWRLATSSLSARPSRTALLVAAVMLSAALIAAVACAIASGNGAIERQLEGQIGTAELRITSSARSGLFDYSVLETVQAWPEVERALPLTREPVSMRITHPILVEAAGGSGSFERGEASYTVTGYGNGVDLATEFESRPADLLAGRLPTDHGEILIDGLMAERLSWLYHQFAGRGGGVRRPGTDTAYLSVEAPEIPERFEGSASAARAINEDVGVRPGDRLEVIRFLDLPVTPDAIETFSEEMLVPRLGPVARLDADFVEAVIRLFRPQIGLRVVGVTRSPPLGGQPQAWMSVETLALVSGSEGGLERIELELDPNADPNAVVAKYEDALPEGMILQTTEKVTSSLDQNLASNQLGFILASVLAFLSASFIIMTGLTTGLAEQQRGLAILRCIGATRTQLAVSQLWTGLIVGGIGAVLGTPLGVFLAWLIVELNQNRLPTGLRVPYGMLMLAAVGSVIAGLIGASFPAYKVSRMTPLRGLSNRSEATKPAHLWKTLWFALAGLVIQAVVVGGAPDGDWLFWGYATLGLPAMFVGYFLLSVPVTAVVVRVIAEPLSALFRLPPKVLRRTVGATPFRHGFTAGAMMAGLALMIAIWTNGGAVLRDWLGKIEFPDAFVNGLRLTEAAQQRLDDLEFVDQTCAITLHPVEVDAFGVSALQQYATSFIAFEPTEFFAMTNVEFLDGDPEIAERRLLEGGAVIVGREFRESKGLGVGDTFVCRDRGTEHSFEIVGVVTSPGLELVSKFFNIGEEYIDQSIHAVFGSRGDMKRLFGSDNIQLIQMSFDRERLAALAPEPPADLGLEGDAWNAEWATEQIETKLAGYGVLQAGSGVQIKDQIQTFIGGSLFVFSAVAIISMIVACFGVANLIVASIESRRFEFGVLRAVGAQPTMLVRLVLAEAVIIGVTAAIVGTLMGVQGAWAGARIYQLLLGLGMELKIPPKPVLFGWGTVLLFTLGAAAPAILRLNRAKTRELLAAARG